MSKSIVHLVFAAALGVAVAVPVFGQTPAEQEAKLIAVLKSDAPRKEKADACRELGRVGTRNAVAPLAALLANDELSHMARYGLEPIPDPAVDEALRAALGQLKGRLLAGVIGSVGVRRDAKAIPALAKLLSDTDVVVAQAAARALGKIGTVEAAKAIQGTLPAAPAANQLAFCEGLFRCAEALAAQGQRADATALYDALRRLAQAPHQVRAGALRGAILSRGREGLPLMAEGLRSDDYVLTAAAARTALEMPGAEVAQILIAELPKLPADKQILVMQTLGKRGDAAALPALFALAKSGAKAVRVAAIKALPEIGDASAIPVLTGLQGDAEREVAQAAQDALAGFPGKDADAAVVAMLGSADLSQRLAAIDLIGRRRMTGCVPALIKATGDAEGKVSASAFKRLGELGSAAEVPALLDLLKRAKDSDLGAAEQALGAVCARTDNPEAWAEKIAAQLAGAQPAQKAALLRVLSAIGGAGALKAVRAAVDDPNKEIHAAAIRALGDWKTADAASALLELSQTAADPKEKMLCLRSYLGLAANAEMTPDRRLAMCQKATGLVQRPEEKKLLLGALGNLQAVGALELIAPYLEDAAVKEEASAAVVALAERLLKGSGATRNAPKLVAPLEKAAQATANPSLAQRAKTLLQQARNK